MLEAISSAWQLFKPSSVTIDNYGFKLHYKVTTFLLVLVALVISGRFLFTPHIDCEVDSESKGRVDNHCWVHGTFTFVNRANDGIDSDIPSPGIGPMKKSDEIEMHRFYAWVLYYWWIVAFIFYASRLVWKLCEGGDTEIFTSDLKNSTISEDTTAKEGVVVAKFLATLHKNKFGACAYFFLEFFNFANALSQILLVKYFLGGGFVTATYLDRPSSLFDKVFPTVTKCTFPKFGPWGMTESTDAQCILPQNMLNKPIFELYFVWLIIVCSVSFLALCYRAAALCFVKIRVYRLKSGAGFESSKDVETVVHHCDYGDWFLLLNIKKNTNKFVFKGIVSKLASGFEPQLQV